MALLYHIQSLDPIWSYKEALDYSYAKGNSRYIQFVCKDATISVPKIGFQLFSSFISQVVNVSGGECDSVFLPDITSKSIRHLSNIISCGSTSIARGDSDMIKNIIFAAESLGVHLKSLSFGAKRINKILVESKEDVNDRNNNSTTVSDVKCEPLVNDNQIFQNDDVYDSGNLVIDSEPEFGKEIKNEVKFDSPKGLLDDGMNVTSKSELELKKVDDFSLKQEQLEVNFKTFEGLRHQLEDQSLYSCDLCGREFPWKTSLRRHIESVHNGRRYHCDQCDFKATRNYCLVEHKRRKHSIIR